jgi:hypothetical protein
MGFDLDAVKLEQVPVRVVRISPVSIIPPVLHSHAFICRPCCIVVTVDSVVKQHVKIGTTTGHILTKFGALLKLVDTFQFWLQSTTMIRFTRRRTRVSCTTRLYEATCFWDSRREKGIFCPVHFCRNLYVSRYHETGESERVVYTFRKFCPHRQIQNGPCNLVSGGSCCRREYNTVLVDSRR